MSDITKLDELMSTIKKWYEEDIPEARTSKLDGNGRKWFLDSIKWDKTLKMEDLRKATDRKELNSTYTERYKETDPKARKGIAAIKIEIGQLYSYNKCFVQRYKSRMQYYKDDLAQKGGRNMYNVWQSVATFNTFKTNLDS